MFPWQAKAVAAAILCASAVCAQESAVFRSNVNLVRVLATVKNQAGQLVGALGKDDFEVYDNGVRQEIGVFERQTEQPLSVALMVDTSGSTGKDLKYETDSASKFIRALLGEGNPLDAVALYSFNDRVTLDQGFTHNAAALERPMKAFKGEAGTSVYDAVFLASGNLEEREGRKVIVLVTDGNDTTSMIKDPKVALNAAQLADAVIYSVVVVPITNDAGRSIGGEHVLIFMAERTGGRTFFPTVGKELDKAFTDIITELRTQYLLGFYPHNVPVTAERFHKLEVRVKSPDLRVSARNGYYGEADNMEGTSKARTTLKSDSGKKRPGK